MSVSCYLIDSNGVGDERDFPFTFKDLIDTCKEIGPISDAPESSVIGRLLFADSVIDAKELYKAASLFDGFSLSAHTLEVLSMIKEEALTSNEF